MSKIFVTLAFSHEGGAIIPKPQFFVSCNNMTCVQLKGADFKGARIGNGNMDGYPARFEYGVTSSKACTKLTFIVNTRAILPPIAWSTADKVEPPPKASSRSSSTASKSSRTSRSTSSITSSRRPRETLDYDEKADRPRISNRVYRDRSESSSRRPIEDRRTSRSPPMKRIEESGRDESPPPRRRTQERRNSESPPRRKIERRRAEDSLSGRRMEDEERNDSPAPPRRKHRYYDDDEDRNERRRDVSPPTRIPSPEHHRLRGERRRLRAADGYNADIFDVGVSR